MKIFKILKRWLDMLSGKSIYHVRQGEGKYYSKEKVYGYYNDMTKKVNNVVLLDDKGIPISKTINGVIAYFPITIFQYGLGLFDLYIETLNTYKNLLISLIGLLKIKKKMVCGTAWVH